MRTARVRRAIAATLLMVACGPGPDRPPAGGGATETRSAGGAVQGAAPAGRLTVLIPPELARAESLQGDGVVLQESYYSVTQDADNLTLSVTGSLVDRNESGTTLAQGTPAATLRGVPVYVTENEGIKTATWIENGTSFALDLECTSQSDERCRSSEYILEQVRSLVERSVRQ